MNKERERDTTYDVTNSPRAAEMIKCPFVQPGCSASTSTLPHRIYGVGQGSLKNQHLLGGLVPKSALHPQN